MTDEEKKCACGTELGKFFTLVAAIFLGVLLAILVSAALLKPKCPCNRPMPLPRPMYERQIPPMGGHWQAKHPDKFYIQGEKFDKKNFKQHRHNFERPQRPDKIQK